MCHSPKKRRSKTYGINDSCMPLAWHLQSQFDLLTNPYPRTGSHNFPHSPCGPAGSDSAATDSCRLAAIWFFNSSVSRKRAD